MFGLGFTEILVVLTVALLVFGPKRLPEIARTLGKSMAELRRTVDEVRYEISRTDIEPPPANPHIDTTTDDTQTTEQDSSETPNGGTTS